MKVLLLAVGSTLLTGMLALTGPVAAGRTPDHCVVRNTRTGTGYIALARAVRAARPGDALTISGVCVGSTVINKDLTLRARPTASWPSPALKGDGLHRVLTVGGEAYLDRTRCYVPPSDIRCPTVVIRGLTIRGGVAEGGGGIDNGGTLTLRDVVVRDNRADLGGGIYNSNNEALLILRGATTIRDNTAEIDGGGIYSDGPVEMHDDSSVRHNMARSPLTGPVYGGGGIFIGGGELLMSGSSSVHSNAAQVSGGGVVSQGMVTMQDRSRIWNNLADLGGGLYGSQLIMTDSASITENGASRKGGGIFLQDGVPRTLAGIRCGVNVADNDAPDGPDMYPYVATADPDGLCAGA